MVKFISFFAAIAAVAFAAESESKVHQLTDDNMEDFVKTHKYALVKFYAPWCGHCKKIAPEFEQAATELAEEVGEEKVALGEIDATEHKKMAEKYNIRGFPTLFWFVDGEESEYGGGRTAAEIKSWCVDMTGPAVKEISSRKLAEEQAGVKPVCIYEGREASTDFEDIASRKRSDFTFYHVAADAEKPTVTVQHKGEEAVVCDDLTSDGLKKCLDNNELPLFGALDGESYGKYMSSGKGLVWGCFEQESSDDLEKVADEHRPLMNELAKEFKDKFAFTYIDTVQFKSAIEGMLGVTEFPTLAVNKKAGDKMKYLYTGEMTVPKVSEFLKGVLDGTIEPTLKSEPVPESQDEPVHVVVGSTLEDDVFQADKDVLFEIYAPWCGHCKKLAPEYEKVAKKIVKEGVEDMVVLAKMDGTANDSPVESISWDGFPTLYYVKAGESEPVKYDGPRDAKGIWKWIKKHHSNSDGLKERLAASKAAEKEEPEAEKGEELVSMEPKPLRPSSLSVSSTATGSPCEGLFKEQLSDERSGVGEEQQQQAGEGTQPSFYILPSRQRFDMNFPSRVLIVVVCGAQERSDDAVKNGIEFMLRSKRRCVVEGSPTFTIGLLHLCELSSVETNAAGDTLHEEVSFGGEMWKSVRTRCGCIRSLCEREDGKLPWLPPELRGSPVESLSLCPNRTSLSDLLARQNQIISLPFGLLRLNNRATTAKAPTTPSKGCDILLNSVERLLEMLRRVPRRAGFFEASTGGGVLDKSVVSICAERNCTTDSGRERLPLLGVRSILRDPTPPNLSDYHAILLLSSENWKIVVDWGLRLVGRGKNVLAIHFNKGSEAQAAEVYMSARRRARDVNPSVNFEMTIRPPCPSIVPIAVDLSKHCSILVMGDSGRKDTRYREMVERCSGNVVIARCELPAEAPPIRDFVVGVGARDQEGARRALSMAFALAASTTGEARGARV
ncbi:hypothetical protein FOZ62_005491, partial [Perkinsus olseni]